MIAAKNFYYRFVKDFKLPIQVLSEPYFLDRLILFNDKFKSYEKYVNTISFIEKRFGGDSSKFLEEYYKVRNDIIESILANEAYKKFNTSLEEISKYSIKDRKFPKKDIYTEDTVKKNLLSIDLSKANFQAYNFHDRNILFNSDSYEDFLSKYTDMDYFKESKYTRQVIFGKLNVSRNITIQRYMMSLIYDLIKSEIIKDSTDLISLTNDELVFEIKDNSFITEENISSIVNLVKDKLNFIVKANFISLDTVKFKRQNVSTLTIYVKKNLLTNIEDFCCVPMAYAAQIYRKLLYNRVTENDLVFDYEGNLSKFLQPLELDEENSTYYNK